MANANVNVHILSRPHGSAIFTLGKTTILAGVYAPIECRASKARFDKAVIEMHYRPKSGLPGVNERLYEQILKNLCETTLLTTKLPRAAIEIVVQEMENDGSTLSAAVNAICFAFLSCATEMHYLFAAATCCLGVDDALHLDPSKLEQDVAKALFVFVFNSTEGAVLASHTNGIFSLQQYEEALLLCKAKACSLFDYYKTVVSEQLLGVSRNQESSGDISE